MDKYIFLIYISTHPLIVFFPRDLLFLKAFKTYALIFFFLTFDFNCTVLPVFISLVIVTSNCIYCSCLILL